MLCSQWMMSSAAAAVSSGANPSSSVLRSDLQDLSGNLIFLEESERAEAAAYPSALK